MEDYTRNLSTNQVNKLIMSYSNENANMQVGKTEDII